MVGFKSIGLLFILLFLASCIPQTKQTECNTNEAFNALLRTCVPVMNGPSSFIDIDSFLPTSTLSKYKNDFSLVQFSIVVSNPYAQTYTVKWERVFNGVPVNLIGTSSGTTYTYSTTPNSLSTQLGIHIITAKVLDGNNSIVDSHSFELKINDVPKPVILNDSNLSHPSYDVAMTPIQSLQNFRYRVSNNGATMSGAGYKIAWKLYKSGVLIYTEDDNFATTGPTNPTPNGWADGSLSSTGYNYPDFPFNPSTYYASYGVGSYILNSRLTNNAGEIVDEKQWAISLAHPPVAQIIGRDIYSSTPLPVFTAVSTAYNGIAYPSGTTYNFIPAGGSNQGDYCVEVADEEGTYAGDSQYVRVDYYLDGATIVYSALTSPGDPKVCLSDATLTTLNSVVFTNSTTTTAQSHTLVARVIDVATGQEYSNTLQSIAPSLGTYPVTWNFNVKPANAAPTVAFGTMTGMTCTTTNAAGTIKSGCSVTSDTNFTVNINLTGDDFYFPITGATEGNFDYSLVLYRNGVPVQTCNKADAGYDGNTDSNGPAYQCVFNIESYDSSGPLNLSAQTYQIKAEISDNGSPLSSTPVTSQSLIWNISPVTEKNTTPSIANWSVSAATEGSTTLPLTFSADITDAERDHHTWIIQYCTSGSGPACPKANLTSGSITRTNSLNPYTFSVNYVPSEDFLLGLTGLNCDQLERNQSCSVEFFLSVTDVPTSATPLSVTSSGSSSTITNFNPAPTLTINFASPAPASFSAATTFAFVGHPMSFSTNPTSILNDISAVTVEKTYRYQWYVKNNTSVTAWTAIDGATTNNLIWTPSLMKDISAPTDNPLKLMLCVEDHPTSVPTSAFETTNPNTALHICSDATPWELTVINNVAVVHDISTSTSAAELATSSSHSGNETAIWYDLPSTFNAVISSAVYTAMVDNNNYIHVKKSLLKKFAQIDNINASQIVSFYPLPPSTGVVFDVKDLSITGTADGKNLYVAYLASRTGSPGSYYPQVRRIDLSETAGKAVPNNHAGKFGFDYDGLGLTNNCVPSGDCTSSAASGVTTITFSPSGGSISGNMVLVTPAGNFTYDFGTYDGVDTICSTCTGATMAQNLADIINQSTNPILAGYSALNAGSSVTISGARANDYFDAYLEAAPHNADQLGKIYIVGSNWYLPFIDSSLGGSNNDRISVYRGSTGVVMGSVAEALFDPITSGGLASIDASTKFDSWYDGTSLWIALVSQSGSKGKLFQADPTTFALTDLNVADTTTMGEDLFGSQALLDIKMSASTSYIYVGATTAPQGLLGSEIKIGIYDQNGDVEEEFEIDSSTNVDAVTDDYFNISDMANFKILPYGTEARFFAISQGTGTDYKLYGARLRQLTASSPWTLSCGDCAPISEQVQNISQHVSLGVAPIRDNLSSDYQLATSGTTPNQGTKDVALVSFGRLNSASATICDPAVGIFNVEGEAIESPTLFDGSTAAPVAPMDAGLYRPSFFKN